LAVAPAERIKRVIAGVSPSTAVAAFAQLWVADEHWAAVERVMKRSS
jgi:enoyl-CoA hydratase